MRSTVADHGVNSNTGLGDTMMMEETYWKQFMTTGKVEDYLQFKACHTEKESKKETEVKKSNAGFGKCDGYRFK